MFRAGQKVVCVDDKGTTCVRVGAIYTVTKVAPNFLCLAGVRGMGISDGMFSTRFRPLVERKTDTGMAILKSLLVPGTKVLEDVQ